MSSSIIHIAFGADDKYAKYLGCCIASILVNSTPEDEFSFYVVDNGISEENKRKIGELQTLKPHQLTFLNIDVSTISHLPQITYYSLAIYMRLFLPDLLPELDRLLYLDCDMIVTTSLRELWEWDLKGKAVGAVKDLGMYFSRKGLQNEFYFNSGMLLMDLAQIREKKYFHRAIHWLEENRDQAVFPDQDALNAVLIGEQMLLPCKWNIQVSNEFKYCCSKYPPLSECLKSKTGILHFVTQCKPDRYLFFVPIRNVYLDIQDLTPWRGETEKGTFVLWLQLLKFRWKDFRRSFKWYESFRYYEHKFKNWLKGEK